MFTNKLRNGVFRYSVLIFESMGTDHCGPIPVHKPYFLILNTWVQPSGMPCMCCISISQIFLCSVQIVSLFPIWRICWSDQQCKLVPQMECYSLAFTVLWRNDLKKCQPNSSLVLVLVSFLSENERKPRKENSEAINSPDAYVSYNEQTSKL